MDVLNLAYRRRNSYSDQPDPDRGTVERRNRRITSHIRVCGMHDGSCAVWGLQEEAGMDLDRACGASGLLA
ncbi:hypothetical protein D9M72_481110 [compost metagenome]